MVPQTRIIERKIAADGTVHEFTCDVIYRAESLIVIAYVMHGGGILPDVGLAVAPGSISYGYFWRDRPYNLYRMKRPDGSIIAHRMDAVADVGWSEELLEYGDLVLDWWVVPPATLVTEDEDEFEAAIAAGLLSDRDVAAARAAEAAVEGGWAAIIAEAEAFERAHLAASATSLHPVTESP